MKKAFPLFAVLVVVSLLLSACGAPPPLKSDKYLDDTSLVTGDASCAPPCFRGIIVGKTTFTDALSKVKADPGFKDVQSTDKAPFQAGWAAANGDQCCQMSADEKTGLINALMIRPKPNMTIKQVIDKYSPPDYVTSVDYSPQEVAIGLVWRKQGLIVWVTPGDANSTLKETDPVVVVLYINPNDMNNLIDTATLQAWNGYLPYQTYKSATPVVTPRVTATPGSQ